jgi:hypothetical protein
MPNDCWNKFTIKAKNEQIKDMLTTMFVDTKPDHYQHFMHGKEVLIFRIWSPWRPCKELLDRLFEKYEGIWIKNIWQEEGGQSGVIVGTKTDLQEIEWTEGCEEEWHARLEEVEMPEVVLAEE